MFIDFGDTIFPPKVKTTKKILEKWNMNHKNEKLL